MTFHIHDRVERKAIYRQCRQCLKRKHWVCLGQDSKEGKRDKEGGEERQGGRGGGGERQGGRVRVEGRKEGRKERRRKEGNSK